MMSRRRKGMASSVILLLLLSMILSTGHWRAASSDEVKHWSGADDELTC